MYLNHFVKKRGRPKLIKRQIKINKPQNTGLIQQLKLKEILSERHYNCALSFQILYKRYLLSINAPLIRTTIWDNIGYVVNSGGYRYTNLPSKQDIKIKMRWYKTNEFLKRKLNQRYELFLQYILWDEYQTTLHNIKSSQAIDLIKEGLNYLET